MSGSIGKDFMALFGLLVVVGALVQVLKDPSGSTALLSAGAGTISGVTTALDNPAKVAG